MPDNFMSSTKRPRPDSSAGSSSRVTRAPKCFAPMASAPLPVAQTLRRVERRFDDAGIAGAAAEIAGESFAYLVLARRRIFAQQFGERDQHARRAKAALQAVIVDEGLLQHRQPALRREPFDGR